MKTQVVVSREAIGVDKFTSPYGNLGNNKPVSGGLWTSSLTDSGKSSWLEFAESEDFYSDDDSLKVYSVEFSNEARLLTIDSEDDYKQALKKYGVATDNVKHPLAIISKAPHILDFEKIKKDYDALSLTQKGLHNNYFSFYGWDCESTVWLNINHIDEITENLTMEEM